MSVLIAYRDQTGLIHKEPNGHCGFGKRNVVAFSPEACGFDVVGRAMPIQDMRCSVCFQMERRLPEQECA